MATSSALETQVGGDHYKTKGIQPIAYIVANGLPFIEGNIVKYVTRWRDKGGIKDLEKAKHYIEMLMELEPPKEVLEPPYWCDKCSGWHRLGSLGC